MAGTGSLTRRADVLGITGISSVQTGYTVGEQGLHLTAKIQDRGYGLGSLQLKPRFETEPELYFILKSPKPCGSVWSSDRFYALQTLLGSLSGNGKS